ncbi:MAG TPA: aldehyde ferredoxin oxidoreductase family protein [Spirochaetia bacterium]|nr:aldehyde ferredoxin oxidoreductase family protein [Spirochaetia bacterium]
MTGDVYRGRVLDVDLSSGRTAEVQLTDAERRLHPGGLSLGARFLWTGQQAGVDPLGPENTLVFGVGGLVGTNLLTASRTEVSAKSPATGLFGTANSGYYWGLELKMAGYDGLVIRGRAQRPVYLWITGQGLEIRDAAGLWGLDAWQSLRLLRAELGDDQVQAALIGPAGENMVRFASIQNGPYDAWARTGLGAVMGSKRLKAVAVRGRGSLRPADPRGFLSLTRETTTKVKASPFYTSFARYGTMLAASPYGAFGALPGKNFQTGRLAGWEENCTRKMVPQLSKRGIACSACPIACAHWTLVGEDLALKDMEVTPVFCLGAGLEILDLRAVARLTAYCQKNGLDIVSAASTVAFATELYERGVLSSRDVGFEPAWGSEEKALALLDLITYRRGIGDVLAEGTRLASRQIPGAYGYAMEVKGLELPIADPRGRWSTWTFGYLTNTRGGDHLRTRNPVENLRYNENPVPYRTERFGFDEAMLTGLDMSARDKEAIFDPETRDVDIPRMAKWSEDLIALYNCLGICIRPPVLHTLGPELLSRLWAAATGMELTPGEMLACGERVWNLQKLFNLREGENIRESVFPERFYREPLNGEAEGKVLDREAVQDTLAEYCRARGWDPASGVPLPGKLAELGIGGE